MHALVLMAPRRNTPADAELQAEHESVLDEPIDDADRGWVGQSDAVDRGALA